MTIETILIMLAIGVVAGWLAGKIVGGGNFGLVGDLVVGVLGAFIGGWLLPGMGIAMGTNLLTAIASATIGAVVLLVILRLVRRA